MGVATLARKTSKPKDRPAPGPRPTALTIKGTLEWRGWVERGADHCRTDVAKLVDAALVHYLQAQGFTEPPPKR